ncbi:MAG: cyclic nucleotide-binding domain-containing protein, partial [Prevotella sp.]|nr:cyclic nucleotide-binding domain-containing protein [Prevotella sp.]
MPNIGLVKRDVARELARRYSTMTHDELDVLESVLVPMKFQKGEKILTEGETCEHIYWIAKGLVRQFYHKNGKEVTEYMAVENHIVMCIESLFKEEPARMQIHTLEPTVIYAMPRKLLEQVAMRSVNIQ